MYSLPSSVETFTIKNQIHEQIFSLLGNAGKTLFATESYLYTEVRSPWYQATLDILSDIWNTPYKKILVYIGIALTSTLIAPPATSFAAAGETTTFIVTAYYSPLPGQSFYLKGNYEAEKRLNGNGTHGASGKPVFAGMIAAPKSYDFGTQIFFEGMGVGTVSDRGGAIVEAWDRGQAYDRIDIWMGSGESGLRRAMAWGRREVRGTIITTGDTSNMNPIDIYGIDNGRVNLSLYPSVRSSANGGVSSDVLSAFADLGYIVENGDVKKMLLAFQLDHGIISAKTDDGAGNYGPKTKAALKEAHDKFNAIQSDELKAIEKARQEMLDERTAWETRYKQAQNSVLSLSTIRRGENSSKVLTLQSVLSSEGFYKGKKDGQMKGSTLLALKKYQKARGLSQSGIVDNSTREALIVDMLEA